jgi:hypothetical protein
LKLNLNLRFTRVAVILCGTIPPEKRRKTRKPGREGNKDMSAQFKEINQDNKVERYQDSPLVRLSGNDCTAVVNMIKHPANAGSNLKSALQRHRDKF